jgi:4-hydroxy-3-polyprenylbenzoate decarboxylase
MPSVKKGRGECQQVVMNPPDVTKLPVLKCWPEDGGSFLTLPVIQTADPHTGIRNVGLYRMQVFEPSMTAMHWHKHKVSARHFNEYKKLGKVMPVAVSLGGDPVYSYSATAPLPDGVDEFMLAGFIRRKKAEMVKCLTLTKENYGMDLFVPADSDFVIEGYIDPNEEYILEGPFGDHTGYYSLADYYPRFHITAITHRKDAVYPATIVGIPPQEDAWIGKATERIFLAPIKMTVVPEIVDMVLPVEGVFHNLVIVKIKKDYAGQAIKVMNALWGAGQMMFTKMMIVVDGDVNIHDNYEVAKYISENTNPETDIIFTAGPTDVLDHSCSKFSFGGKMGIDATRKMEEETDGRSQKPEVGNQIFSNEEIKSLFPEIKEINSSLIDKGIALLLVSIEKNRKNHVKEIAQNLAETSGMKKVKVVLFLEHEMDISDISDAVWRFSNNVDPKRDHINITSADSSRSFIAFDGTRKTKEFDGFERDWPNILVSDEKTIHHIDEIWSKLGLGAFISSPSRKYRKQMYEGGAVAL